MIQLDGMPPNDTIRWNDDTCTIRWNASPVIQYISIQLDGMPPNDTIRWNDDTCTIRWNASPVIQYIYSIELKAPP
jgi:hypothetical protein